MIQHHNNQYTPEIPSMRKRRIERLEQKLRQLGYSEQRIQIIKDYINALCYNIISKELDT